MFNRKGLIMYTLIASMGLTSVGCSYGAVASHQGKLYVVRNDTVLFGVLRKIFECTPKAGGKMECVELEGNP